MLSRPGWRLHGRVRGEESRCTLEIRVFYVGYDSMKSFLEKKGTLQCPLFLEGGTGAGRISGLPVALVARPAARCLVNIYIPRGLAGARSPSLAPHGSHLGGQECKHRRPGLTLPIWPCPLGALGHVVPPRSPLPPPHPLATPSWDGIRWCF